MKKYSISSIFILFLLNNLSLYAMDHFINQETNIDSILKIKPPIKYDENLKIKDIIEFKINHKKIENRLEEMLMKTVKGVVNTDLLLGINNFNYENNKKDIYKFFLWIMNYI